MKIDWFRIDDFCKDLPEVTSPLIYAKKGFNPDGLFSERIFGPVKNYACSCGIYWGRHKVNEVCSDCGVTIQHSNVRRKNMAKISLPFAVMNPIMLYLVSRVGKTTITNILLSMIYDDTISGYWYNPDSDRYNKIKKADPLSDVEATVVPDGAIVYSGPKGMYQLVKDRAEKFAENDKNWKFILNNIEAFWMKSIGVIPPEFRPVSKSKDVQMRDKLNEYYITILNFSQINKQNPLDENTDNDIYRINFKNLQKHIFDLYDYIFSKFSKKGGLIRGSILGKRIDFSGRAVISPDPKLHIDQMGIPYLMAMEFFKLQVAKRLLELRNFTDSKGVVHKFTRYDPAIAFVDRCFDTDDHCLFDIVSEIAQGKLVILNRQPTLHRMGLLSFECIVHNDYTIKIHPFACEPYNADFDGDQMAAYISLYDEAEKSNREHMFIMNNLISPSTGDLCLSVNQDVVLGLYKLTKPETPQVDYVIGEGKDAVTIKTTPGRIEFNKILPKGFPFVNQAIGKKQIHRILNVVVKNYDAETIKTVLDNVKNLGFSKTTVIGSTFSLENLKVNPSVPKLISDIVDDPNKSLAEKFFELQDAGKKHQKEFAYADFIESGSRGTWDQANQLIFCKGYMSNSKGVVVPTPIKNNLITGLTKKEFFLSCYGARKALLDTALNTAVSGYLTRKLVYCGINVEGGELDDCGTTDYYEVTIPENLSEEDIQNRTANIVNEQKRKIEQDKLRALKEKIDPVKLARSLRYRWYMDDDGILKQITENNYDQFYGRTLKLRSPLFCKSGKLCKKCYGDSLKYCHSKYLGVISAQAMGEVATQLTLRTFHVGGVAQMTKGQQDNTQQDIINDLGRVKKILHGGSSYNTDYRQMIEDLFSIYSHHKVLLSVHFELIVSQLMRIGNMRWRLHPDRMNITPQLVSIEKVPPYESFLLALAFSKPYTYIISGILGSSQSADGILEKMLTNKA